jgi:hypothetical protein
MRPELRLTPSAREALAALEREPGGAGTPKQVCKTLGLLETDPRHPSLQTHKYRSLKGPGGEEVFEAYLQQHTPAAFRVFFYYGPDRREGRRRIPVLTIIAITPHP